MEGRGPSVRSPRRRRRLPDGRSVPVARSVQLRSGKAAFSPSMQLRSRRVQKGSNVRGAATEASVGASVVESAHGSVRPAGVVVEFSVAVRVSAAGVVVLISVAPCRCRPTRRGPPVRASGGSVGPAESDDPTGAGGRFGCGFSGRAERLGVGGRSAVSGVDGHRWCLSRGAFGSRRFGRRRRVQCTRTTTGMYPHLPPYLS